MKNRKGFTLIELMIVIAIIGILAAMAIPNFKKARWSARQKSCYSNIRVLQGAIEMYNMDNNTMMSSSLSLEGLKNGNYIKKVEDFQGNNTPETTCSYSISGDITSEGQVVCGYHGAVDSSVVGNVM